MIKISLFTVGVLPVPPVKGGAVENLIKLLLDENEIQEKVEFSVTSIYDITAEKESRKYKNTRFFFVKIPMLFRLLDHLLFFTVRILFSEKAQSFKMLFSRIYYIGCCKKYFLSNNFDFIVAENHPSLFWVMKNSRMRKKYSDKFFYHAHNEPNINWGCKKEIVQCKKILAVSDFIGQAFKKKYPNTSLKYVVVQNGINIDLFNQSLSNSEKIKLRSLFGIKDKDFVILYAGRLIKSKGVLELVQAFTNFNVVNKKLLIVGATFFSDSSNDKKIQNEIEQIINDNKENVVFTGFVSYNDIWKYYKISDVAVFPSLCNEAALLTNIEAMISGLPVITTTSGGIPEYSNVKNAILLDRDENLVNNIINNLDDLYKNQEKRRMMGRSNHEFATKFSADQFYQSFIREFGFEK